MLSSKYPGWSCEPIDFLRSIVLCNSMHTLFFTTGDHLCTVKCKIFYVTSISTISKIKEWGNGIGSEG